MPRKFFRKVMPNVDKVREVKALSMFGDTLFHPALWHLNRRSAAGGVAVGLFCGLIPGPLQMLGSADRVRSFARESAVGAGHDPLYEPDHDRAAVPARI